MTTTLSNPESFRQILGTKFYTGDLDGLLELSLHGGLVVVPAAPALAELPRDHAYRAAIERSDFAITDSGFMVLLWYFLKGERLMRISGLKYIRALIKTPAFGRENTSFWIMPSRKECEVNLAWLNANGVPLKPDATYLAPKYPEGELRDAELLAAIERQKPPYIVINLGGGVQERLGLYLRDHLSYRPTIVCTGAAIAFLTGQQANIPSWADRMMLGWLFRSMSAPKKFVPRYVKALRLVPILWRYGSQSVAA